jgi:signal transduction histidine kinase
MLRLLATLGLTAAEFSHETGMTFQAVRLDFQQVFAVALEGRAGDNDFANLVERARGMVDRLDALTSYLNELASARSARELAPVSASRSVEEFARGMSQLAARGETELLVQTPPLDGLYTKPMHRAEVASILLNFYSNSMKAMKRTKGARRIYVEAEREDEEIVIRFSDTGDGIREEDRERIFDLFYTTRAASPASASTLEESIGTGLGLWIVRQIVSRADGEAAVVDPAEGYSTTLEVRLPASEEE